MAELIPIETVLDYADADMHIVSDAAKDYLKYNRDDEYVKMSELREKIGKRFGYPVEERIELLPTADVQPVKRGKWEKKRGYLVCSNCGMTVDTIGYTYEEQEEVFRYCSCCGYRMDGDVEWHDTK